MDEETKQQMPGAAWFLLGFAPRLPLDLLGMVIR